MKDGSDKQAEMKALIEALDLIPLTKEGGLIRQTYVSAFQSAGEAAGCETCGTAIYYMLRGKAFSHMHKLTDDEMYHFYKGDPVELVELFPDGSSSVTILGPDIARGESVQHLVPAGTWQGSRLCPGGTYALMATTNWPGYTDACYTHGDAEELIRDYPGMEEKIRSLTGEVSY